MFQMTVCGNAVADPVSRTTKSGKTVCNFTLGIPQRKKTPEGEQRSVFIQFTAWHPVAEYCAAYLRKGKKAVVTADNIDARVYQKKEGGTGVQLTADAMSVEVFREMPSDAGQAANAKGYQGEDPTSSGFPDGFIAVEDLPDLPF